MGICEKRYKTAADTARDMRKRGKMDYKHLFCECGGVIGMYDRKNFTCDKCGKEYQLCKLKYDVLMTNDKTGWQFPMIHK